MAWISLDVRLLAIGYEIWALDHMFEVSEQQIAYLREQDTVRTYLRLHHETRKDDEADRDLEIEMLRDRTEVVIPRFLRYSLLVSAWAVYEAGVMEVARYLADHLQATKTISDNRGKNEDFLTRARRYFNAVLKVEIDTNVERTKRLQQLVTIRHAIAHANGRVAILKQKSRDSITRMASEGVGISMSEGFIIVEADFVRRSVAAAIESLGELVERAKTH